MANETSMKRPLLGGILAAIAASLCCVGPLVLLTLGVGGAWVGNLTALTPYRPLFIGVTLIFLWLAFRRLYLVPRHCTPGTPCADPSTLRNQRILFWVVTLLLAALLVFPWVAPLILG
ncbi:MAG TPA: mercury transporter MerT [Sedimenticola thiotaurini]|uniref:Mercuric transport protein MerT n=1 Tax=Sedimenticola thiotaurini TaxID=1543721 RepID=A0A831RP32_9GAMM|nr:mercury transporter MerT [Sedimenticola thiotaurini]